MQPNAEEFQIIERAMLNHIAIVIPDLDQNVTWLRDLCRQFGPLVPHVLDQLNYPESFEISTIARQNGTANSRKTVIPTIAFWCPDLNYEGNPSDTIFCIQRNFQDKAIR